MSLGKRTHIIQSDRRQRIAGSEECCKGNIDYNPHLAGSYTTALYILKDHYNWNDAWTKLYAKNNTTMQAATRILSKELPNNVMDYVAFTNLHKFVSVCRGCKKNGNEKCWREECKEAKTLNCRGGGDNRKWYSKDIEIQFLMDEIVLYNPDIIVFQGSASKLPTENMKILESKYNIIVAYHPSAWNVGANKIEYVKKIADKML